MKSLRRTSFDDSYFKTSSIPFFRRIDIARLVKIIARHKTKGDLLEIGCGDGLLARAFCGTFDVYASDVSESAIRCASRLIDPLRLRILNIENDDITGKYDVILALNVLEHIKNPRKAVGKIKRSLNDDGIFVFSAPNNYGLYGAAATRIMNFFDRTHVSTLRRAEWMKLFDESGMYPAELINGTSFGLTHNKLAKHISSTFIAVFRKSAQNG